MTLIYQNKKNNEFQPECIVPGPMTGGLTIDIASCGFLLLVVWYLKARSSILRMVTAGIPYVRMIMA